MPWKASSVMEEKVRFVLEYEQDERTMTELCEVYGIARETGYVWLRRYRERGLEGLVERNRAALHHGNQTAKETEEAVLELRQAHMRWGPRKLKRVLERDQAHQRWPAASTIGELLKREGLVVARKKRRRTEPYTEPLAHAAGVVRGFQRLVPYWRWRAHRSADHHGRLQPISFALPDGGEDGHVTGAGHLRSGVSRVRNAAGDSYRQWSAFRFLGNRRAIAAGGVVDEAGDRAGAD